MLGGQAESETESAREELAIRGVVDLDSVPPPSRKRIYLAMQKMLNAYFPARSECPARPLSALLARLGPVGLPSDGIRFNQQEYDIGFAVLRLNVERGTSLIQSCIAANSTDALFSTRDQFLRLLDSLAAGRMVSLDISFALLRMDVKALQLWHDKVEVVVVVGLEDILRRVLTGF